MKGFLKPTIGKIILMIVLLVIFIYIYNQIPLNLPLRIFNSCTLIYPSNCKPVNTPNFILDLIISYLISCLIIYLYTKLRKSLNTK